MPPGVKGPDMGGVPIVRGIGWGFMAFVLNIQPGYRETEAAKPRAAVGLNDISARRQLRRLGKDLVTISVPLALYQEMEANVSGSFLEKDQWQSLVSTEP